MKDNKADFKRLGHSATSIVAAVWQAYERSPNKAFWPPRELSEVIRELMLCVRCLLCFLPYLLIRLGLPSTLDDIREFIDDRIKKSRTIRFITTVTDRAKIQEYRERLDDAISKFEVSDQKLSMDILMRLTGNYQGFIPLKYQRCRIPATQRESGDQGYVG